MHKVQLPFVLLLLSVISLQAQWIYLPPIPDPAVIGPGGGITYGGGYIWAIVGNDDDGFYAYDIGQEDWITLEPVPEDIFYAGAIAYETGGEKRVFVVASIEDEPDQLFIYTKYRPTGYEGEWNDPDEYPIYLPEKQDCGPGVSLAYQPLGYPQVGGWLYLLLGGDTQKFYGIFITDTAVGPRGAIRYEWKRLADIPLPVTAGGALCYDAYSKSLFALVGGGKQLIYRYDINSNIWDLPGDTPLPANDGSSIIAGPSAPNLYSRLAAIFGWSAAIDTHRICYFRPPYYYWYPHNSPLPAILGSGASLAYEPRADDLYLVIGGERPYFYYNPFPWSIEEGPQTQKTIDLSQKTRISYDFDKIVIHYSTDAATHVGIQIYDLMGKRVKTLLSTDIGKGEHQVVWDKTNNSNRKVTKGVYFITIDKENKKEGLKVIIR